MAQEYELALVHGQRGPFKFHTPKVVGLEAETEAKPLRGIDLDRIPDKLEDRQHDPD